MSTRFSGETCFGSVPGRESELLVAACCGVDLFNDVIKPFARNIKDA